MPRAVTVVPEVMAARPLLLPVPRYRVVDETTTVFAVPMVGVTAMSSPVTEVTLPLTTKLDSA